MISYSNQNELYIKGFELVVMFIFLWSAKRKPHPAFRNCGFQTIQLSITKPKHTLFSLLNPY
jgi:hypothetical protein